MCPPNLITVRSAIYQQMRGNCSTNRCSKTTGVQSETDSQLGQGRTIVSSHNKFEINPIIGLSANRRKHQHSEGQTETDAQGHSYVLLQLCWCRTQEWTALCVRASVHPTIILKKFPLTIGAMSCHAGVCVWHKASIPWKSKLGMMPT